MRAFAVSERRAASAAAFALLLGLGMAPFFPAQQEANRPDYPWPQGSGGGTVASRFPPPKGFDRLPAPAGGFAAWLRGLPLKPGRSEVHLHDGRPKANQSAHCAVLDMDIGKGDLQQCADAIIRLRAEYLYSRGCEEAIRFAFTSGDLARWSDWRAGMRPKVRKNRVSWDRAAQPENSYANFRKYLGVVFTYSGSASLAREAEKVPDPSRPEPGDFFIRGGSPGHAVLVVDVAQNANGERVFLLAQSYMPAQDIQVLKNPSDPTSPWYRARASGPLPTPEWPFEHEDLRRFPEASCE